MPTILDCDQHPLADRMLETFQAHDKLVGYLTSHTHEWAYAELGPDGDGRQIPQVVAGNGGSPLSNGDIFGFTLVRVYTSGKVTATSYGRIVGANDRISIGVVGCGGRG